MKCGVLLALLENGSCRAIALIALRGTVCRDSFEYEHEYRLAPEYEYDPSQNEQALRDLRALRGKTPSPARHDVGRFFGKLPRRRVRSQAAAWERGHVKPIAPGQSARGRRKWEHG